VEADRVDAIAGLLIGASLSFHWVMTADDLQQHREQFPIDAYLLALGVIGLVSLLIVTLCMPLAVPGFSLPGVLAETLTTAGTLYTSVLHTLFFVD
jgi:hypothetical protein